MLLLDFKPSLRFFFDSFDVEIIVRGWRFFVQQVASLASDQCHNAFYDE